MSTAFDTFDKSPLDAFVESPLDARNAPGGKVLFYDKIRTPNLGDFDETRLLPVLVGPNGPYHGMTVHALVDDERYRWSGNIDDYALVHLSYSGFTIGGLPVPQEELYSGHRTVLYEDGQGEDSLRRFPWRQDFARASGLTLGDTPPIDPLPRNVFYPPNQDSISAEGMTLGFYHVATYGNASGGIPLHARPSGLPSGLGFNDMEIVRDGILYVYLMEPKFWNIANNPSGFPAGAVENYQTFAKNLIGFGA